MGAVLNSKSEYNRCYIPRLRVVEEDETTEMEKQEAEQAKEVEEGLRRELVAWEAGKRKIRKSSIIQKSVSVKNRRQGYPDKEGRAPKRRKFPLIKNWGEEEQACRKEEQGDSNGSSITVDYLSCLEDDPYTEPEDPALTIIDPSHTRGLDTPLNTTLSTPEDRALVPPGIQSQRQENEEEGGYEDCTGSSLIYWRPCRQGDDPRIEQEDPVQVPTDPLLKRNQESFSKDDIRWYLSSGGGGGGGGSYVDNNGGGSYMENSGGGGYVENENDCVNINTDAMSVRTNENEPDLV